MRVLLTAVVVALFLVPAGVSHADAEPCDDSSALADPNLREWTQSTDNGFNQLLPGFALAVAQDWSRLPTIPTFFAATPDGVCDLRDLEAVLASAGRELQTQSDYEAAAWLVAQATDPAKLGAQTLDRVTSFEWLADGADVTLVTKSPDTGSIVRWDVTLDHAGHADATWTVIAHEKGLRTEIEGWYLNVGETGPGDIAPMVSKSVLFPTYDGKSIRINYNTNVYADAADEAADVARNGWGAARSYDTIKRDWGFHSADPDQFIDVTLDGCACIYRGNNVNIHMPPHLQQWIFDLIGSWYPDEDGVVEDVLGHELFHHFQYSVMQWNQGRWVTEGTARFAETALTPEYCHVPGSLQFMSNQNGFGYMMLNPSASPQSNSYSFGLAWGHIYDTNGGIEVIRRILVESGQNSAFPGFIDRALDSMPGDHDTFQDAMLDFGPRLVTRDFEWERWDGTASYNWANEWLAPLNVLEVRTFGQNLPAASFSANVPQYAFLFHDMDWEDLDESGAAVVAQGPTNNQYTFIGTDDTGEYQFRSFTGAGAEVALDDLILMSTRAGSGSGSTTFTVAQV